MKDSALDRILKRYNVQDWVKPLIVEYIKKDPINAIKKARSINDFKRKKGSFDKNYVTLPNGIKIETKIIIHVLKTILAIERMLDKLAKQWLKESGISKRETDYYKYLIRSSSKKAKALNIVLDALPRVRAISDYPKDLDELFNYIAELDSFEERLIALEIGVRYSFNKAYGMVLYRVFYPASSELARLLKYGFTSNEAGRYEELAKYIAAEVADKDKIIEIIESIGKFIYHTSIKYLNIAKRYQIENELMLLINVAIAYPFQVLKELGYNIDPIAQLSIIKNNAGDLYGRTTESRKAK
ncbi:MAG: hypothetical protein ARM1_0351 [Candidatus Micrarchaeota archaeon]|nr:MAG: hypothetical protein ARM1_0351 [Candidatus Micrarchaeota archaeon]